MTRGPRAKHGTLSDDDRRVWRAVASTVQRSHTARASLTASSATRPPAAPLPERAARRTAAQTRAGVDALQALITQQNAAATTLVFTPTPTPPDGYHHSAQSGWPLSPGMTQNMDRQTARRLARGKLAIEGRLDLHGMSQERAFVAVGGFIRASAQAGKRCVLIVTGKGLGQRGGGVLRAQVPQWLNLAQNRPDIVGFTHAQPRDGGSGALYVYLRRRKARV